MALLKRVKEASMSQNTTTIMVVDKCRERKEFFILAGEKLEELERFLFLGSLVNIKDCTNMYLLFNFNNGLAKITPFTRTIDGLIPVYIMWLQVELIMN